MCIQKSVADRLNEQRFEQVEGRLDRIEVLLTKPVEHAGIRAL